MIQDNDAIVVVFSKVQVRQRKLAHFLKTFGLAGLLPQGPEMAAMMNKFQFVVDGWNDDPQEVYAIAEIRRFYQHLHTVWPYWFYFCDLRTETLQMITLCLLPNLKGYKRVGEPKSSVEYDPRDLLDFIARNFAPLNLMMERAGMSEMDNYNRTREVFLYYGLPYDAEPPEE
jgi:hypothetical protein